MKYLAAVETKLERTPSFSSFMFHKTDSSILPDNSITVGGGI